jgi:hypothetical protein
MAEAKKPAKTKAPKAKPAPKTKRSAPGAAAVQDAAAADDSLTDKEREDLFLKDVDSLATAKEKLAKVVADVRNVKKRIKSHGFTVAQVETAIEMDTPEGEAKVKERMEETLQAARWCGVPWGAQLDMFNGAPDRTPIADRAYAEGERASMQNKPATPQYSPDTEAYRRYMDGFHSHQKTIAKGLKKKPDGNGNGSKEPAAEVTSGERVTRSEFKERMSTMTAQEADGSPKMH